jgi:hypothetical protein
VTLEIGVGLLGIRVTISPVTGVLSKLLITAEWFVPGISTLFVETLTLISILVPALIIKYLLLVKS